MMLTYVERLDFLGISSLGRFVQCVVVVLVVVIVLGSDGRGVVLNGGSVVAASPNCLVRQDWTLNINKIKS